MTVAVVHSQNEKAKLKNKADPSPNSSGMNGNPTLPVVQEIEDCPRKDSPLASDNEKRPGGQQKTDVSTDVGKDKTIAAREKSSNGGKAVKRIFFWSVDSGRTESTVNNDEWTEDDPDEMFPVFQMTEYV